MDIDGENDQYENKENNYYWNKKYEPTKYEDLNFHGSINPFILKLSKSDEFNHLLFYGHKGGGKKARIKIFLQLYFEINDIKQISKIENKEVTINNGNKINVYFIKSTHHIEINMVEQEENVSFKTRDKDIITTFVKEEATIANEEGLKYIVTEKKYVHKIIVIHHADQLSHDAQYALRRIMEKCLNHCRFILVCEKLSNIIEPLQSRCFGIRIPLPQENDILIVLKNVAKKEEIILQENNKNDNNHIHHHILNENKIQKIIDHCDRNINHALLMLQCYMITGELILEQEWEEKLKQIINIILIHPQKIQSIIDLRPLLYDIICEYGIPSSEIFKKIIYLICPKLDQCMITIAINLATKYQHRSCSTNNKIVYHVETFFVFFMNLYSIYLKKSILLK